MYDVSTSTAKRSGYPLRPEFVESLFYLYRATRDPYLRVMAAEVIEAIEHATKTECGYATVQDVNTHLLEDRMESFFLSETLKYLFLIFADDDHFLLNAGSSGKVIRVSGIECIIAAGGYIFNTEAHPVDVSCTDCCMHVRETLNYLNKRHTSQSRGSGGDTAFDEQENILSDNLHRRSTSCFHSSDKERFLNSIFSKGHRVPAMQSESFEFDYMTCPVQSLFSRFSLYGQVAKS